MKDAYEMNRDYAVKLLCKAKKGEFHYSRLREIFLSICQKSWKRYDDILGEYVLTSDGSMAFRFFEKYIDEIKFGLEYATDGKVRYIGTNDLSTFIVE